MKKIEIPFPSLEVLKATISPLLSSEGIFIETQFPPAVGDNLEMAFLVGPEKKEAARFRAQVKAHEPDDPTLITKKGVQLTFHELYPSAKKLFSELLKPSKESESEDMLSLDDLDNMVGESKGDQEKTQSLSEGEIKKHLADQAPTVELSPEEVEVQKNESDKLKSLADQLTDFTKRPEPGSVKEESFSHPSTEVKEFSADDFSSLQGMDSYNISDVIVGIDLGTCNSCVAMVKDNEPKVLSDDQENTTTPSVVSYMEDGSVIVGRDALSQMAKNPKTSIFGAKRFVGRNYHSPLYRKCFDFSLTRSFPMIKTTLRLIFLEKQSA